MVVGTATEVVVRVMALMAVVIEMVEVGSVMVAVKE